jgi:sugar phosphate isomerase/epimerase
MKPITEPLIRMSKAGEQFSRKYVRAKLKAVETRERRAPAHLHRVKDCLRRIIEHAASKNVRIALESRRDYEEIPTERELPALLDEFHSQHVGYWHDFGHSQIKENLGFIDHAEWLRALGPRAFGCHVQDCIWPARDHEPPFTGSIDFEKLVPLLPTNCLFVWEMGPNKTADAIRQSVESWMKHFPSAKH